MVLMELQLHPRAASLTCAWAHVDGVVLKSAAAMNQLLSSRVGGEGWKKPRMSVVTAWQPIHLHICLVVNVVIC